MSEEHFGGVIGNVPPPSPDFTGKCPCGCGARWDNGVELHGLDHAEAEIDDLRGRLSRIHAAAESDADLQAESLSGVRGFLLREADLDG